MHTTGARPLAHSTHHRGGEGEGGGGGGGVDAPDHGRGYDDAVIPPLHRAWKVLRPGIVVVAAVVGIIIRT